METVFYAPRRGLWKLPRHIAMLDFRHVYFLPCFRCLAPSIAVIRIGYPSQLRQYAATF